MAQDGCLPAGGLDDDPSISEIQYDDVDPEYAREVASARTDQYAEDAYDVVFSGGGWGHGVGLSQFAAQGAASLGCTYPQILQAHFPGTALEQRPSRDPLRLKLWTTGASGTASVWAKDPVTWQTCEQSDDGSIVSDSCDTWRRNPRAAW